MQFSLHRLPHSAKAQIRSWVTPCGICVVKSGIWTGFFFPRQYHPTNAAYSFDLDTVKPVLNGISRDQNIFPLKTGFRLIKVHYI